MWRGGWRRGGEGGVCGNDVRGEVEGMGGKEGLWACWFARGWEFGVRRISAQIPRARSLSRDVG